MSTIEVLAAAISEGAARTTWAAETFAVAEAYDSSAELYKGMTTGSHVNVGMSREAVLVRPERALRQTEEPQPPTPPPPPLPDEALPTRFYGRQILDPVREKLKRGEKVSFLVETADDFSGLDLGALWEDMKAAGSVGLKYRSSWERMAVVTDKEWLRHGMAVAGWLSPGEMRAFEPHELEAAKAWVGGAG